MQRNGFGLTRGFPKMLARGMLSNSGNTPAPGPSRPGATLRSPAGAGGPVARAGVAHSRCGSPVGRESITLFRRGVGPSHLLKCQLVRGTLDRDQFVENVTGVATHPPHVRHDTDPVVISPAACLRRPCILITEMRQPGQFTSDPKPVQESLRRVDAEPARVHPRVRPEVVENAEHTRQRLGTHPPSAASQSRSCPVTFPSLSMRGTLFWPPALPRDAIHAANPPGRTARTSGASMVRSFARCAA